MSSDERITPAQISRRTLLQTGSLVGLANTSTPAQAGPGQDIAAENRHLPPDASQISYNAAPGDFAVQRSVHNRLAERISVLDFDVDPGGKKDSTAGFRAAMEAVGAGELYVPQGTYLVSQLGMLARAGRRIRGASRWETVLKLHGDNDALFANEAAMRGTSAFHLISDLTIDLAGTNSTGVDLASVNASVITRVHFRGNSAGERSAGVGVRFAAPLKRGAYDNVLHDCTFEKLHRAIVWDGGANNNSANGCRVLNCDIGFDIAPDELVDTPRIIGGRVEACRVGLREGSLNGCYIGIRFEANFEADIVFTASSQQAMVLGGSTASSALVLKDIDLAESPHVESSDLGFQMIEESPSRPKVSTGRHVFGRAGKAPQPHPAPDYAAYFADDVILANSTSLAFAADHRGGKVDVLHIDQGGDLAVSAFDEAAREFRTIAIGGGPALRPIGHGATDLGTSSNAFRALNVAEGVHVAGEQVLGKRAPAIAPDRSAGPSAETVNKILQALEHHGLIDRT